MERQQRRRLVAASEQQRLQAAQMAKLQQARDMQEKVWPPRTTETLLPPMTPGLHRARQAHTQMYVQQQHLQQHQSHSSLRTLLLQKPCPRRTASVTRTTNAQRRVLLS